MEFTRQELFDLLNRPVPLWLHNADLSAANLHQADLKEADLSAADLHGTNLSGANLPGANLAGTAPTVTIHTPQAGQPLALAAGTRLGR